MCGRYASFRQAQDLADAFARAGYIQDVLFADGTEGFSESFNVAPTTDVRIIVDRALTASMAHSLVDSHGAEVARVEELIAGNLPEHTADDALVRQVRRARWGLVPPWAKDPAIGSKMINARLETITEKPSFKKAFATKRCIVPVDGYYEWTAPLPGSKLKTPHYITPADGSCFAFAGIYEFWKQKDAHGDEPAQWLVTVSIITTAAEGEMLDIHSRRPVHLAADSWDAWLDQETSVDEALAIASQPFCEVRHFVVSTEVNKVGNNHAGLIAPTGLLG